MSLQSPKKITDLPFEIHSHIFEFCTIKEILALKCTNTLFKNYTLQYIIHIKERNGLSLSDLKKRLAIIKFSHFKSLRVTPPYVKKNPSELFCEDISALCNDFDKKLKVDCSELYAISSTDFTAMFKKSLIAKDFRLAEMLSSSPKFKRLSFWNFSEALSCAVEAKIPDLLQKLLDIRNHFDTDDDLSVVDEAFIKICKSGLAQMFQIICNHPRFALIDHETFFQGFIQSIKFSSYSIIDKFLSHPRFALFNSSELSIAVVEVFDTSNLNLLNAFIMDPFFDKITQDHYKELVFIAALTTTWPLYKRFLCDKRIRNLPFNSWFSSAALFGLKKTIEHLTKR